MAKKPELTRFERLTLGIAPKWTLNRVRARLAVDSVRHYEAAQGSRRTQNWARNRGDANAVLMQALVEIRMHGRDLVRNNAWAKKSQRVVANNAVGHGIVPKPINVSPTTAAKTLQLWKAWAGSTECESEGRHTFYGLQHLAMKSIFESGEILFRRRIRRPKDQLTIPLQIQVLEADFLDSTKTYPGTTTQGPTIQGVEYDLIGRRSAYWIYDHHPGNALGGGVSNRIPASEIIHVAYTERPGQVRGMSWLAAAVVNLKDLDDYEDATLMKQKIAACFAAFVTDMESPSTALGATDPVQPLVETLEPGLISYLPPGKEVQFGTPPATSDHDSFTKTYLRKIAAACGVTYEDMTGDYSQVNFSSARMARIAHWGQVGDWQNNMLIPLLCQGVWAWAMEAASAANEIPPGEMPDAEWTVPPMPMIEPDKEGLAYSRLVRNGVMTFSEMIREQGGDPDAHFAEYAADVAKLKQLGLTLDSDASMVTQAGQVQIQPVDPNQIPDSKTA